MPGRNPVMKLLGMILLAFMLSSCVGFDVNMRGWQVKGFAALPLETPLVEHHTRVVQAPPVYRAPVYQPPRVEYRDRWHERTRTHNVVRTRTVTRHEPCTPPHRLMFQSPYYNPDHVRRFRDLQRWVKRNCS